jgi:OPA family glycerol-3-phosphate transporter-like MFS transporter
MATTPNHSSEFQVRRFQNWITLVLTYAAMYMARYNFSFANKALSDQYGWSKSQIGGIISMASLVYGLAALFNGPIADRIGGRKAMIIGASGALVFNLMFGLGGFLGFLGRGPVLLAYLATAWTLNMYFQSFSALSLIKVNAGWFHVSERGVFSSIFGSMIQLGRAGVYWLLPLPFVALLPWEYKFFLPAIVVAVMLVFTLLTVQNTPADAGLAAFDPEDATSGDTEEVTLAYVFKRVFTNPIAITIAAAEFCTGILRKGFEEWFPRYMQEAQHLKLEDPVFRSGAMTIVLGGIARPWRSSATRWCASACGRSGIRPVSTP